VEDQDNNYKRMGRESENKIQNGSTHYDGVGYAKVA